MEPKSKEEIIRLTVKFLAGNAEEDELLCLKNWIESSVSNKTYFQQIKNIYEITVGTQNVEHISTEAALRKILPKLKSPGKNKNIFFYWQRIASVLLIPVIVGGYFWNKLSTQAYTSQVTYNEVFAAFGTRSAVKLADGTKVWLNSGSSLRYPDKFTQKQRKVYLLGEAYFEVKSDKEHPFIVQTSLLKVKATGTKFNVCAYPNESNNHVTLVEGKVAVSLCNDSKNIQELAPSQNLILDTISNEMTVSDFEDIYRFIAWKDGKLVFRNEPLSQVIHKISQYYNVDIELQGKELQEYRYRATFKEESLDDILKLLKLSSPVNYREIERKHLPDGSFPRKKIIIFPVQNQR